MERKDTPIEPSLIQRVSGAVKYAITGVKPDDWFSPNQPIAPVAQEQAVGRQYDYAVGQNVKITPRQGEGNNGVTYSELRLLADSHDITRLVIETKKDQISRQKWAIKYKDGRDGDGRIDEIKRFFYRPDKINTHKQWLRMIVEDLLVIDATAIYPRKNRGGGLYSLDLIDPATINRMIDSGGRTPMSPSPAYQQILKGVPAVDYTVDELLYSNRNRRTNKLYGFSPVEQIILTVNMALRRQGSQLEYFTSGTVPDAIMEVPADWTPDNIAQFQKYWDSILENNTAERRKARFVPSGAKYTETKTQLLKDEFDEWLAKIVCFAFSISPQAITKTMNRASAEVSVDTAVEEGLSPWLEYIKDIHDEIIMEYFGFDDIEFVWEQERSIDPKVQAEIDQIYIASNVYDAKYVQKRMGIDGIEAPEQIEISEKLSKADDNPVDDYAAELEIALGKLLADIADKISSVVSVENIDTIDIAQYFDDFIKEIEASDNQIMGQAIKEALADLNITVSDAFEVASEEAQKWTKERSAELIGKKYVDGALVDNPNPKWAITETTRESIRRDVQKVLDGELKSTELKDTIKSNYAFSEARAKMIAITETNTAWNQGNLSAWKASGVVEGKRSILGTNEKHGEDDIANAAQGAIPIDKAFQSGHMGPSYHPNCRCSLTPVLKLKKG